MHKAFAPFIYLLIRSTTPISSHVVFVQVTGVGEDQISYTNWSLNRILERLTGFHFRMSMLEAGRDSVGYGVAREERPTEGRTRLFPRGRVEGVRRVGGSDSNRGDTYL